MKKINKEIDFSLSWTWVLVLYRDLYTQLPAIRNADQFQSKRIKQVINF